LNCFNLSAQKKDYVIFQNEEANLLFLRAQDLKTDNKDVEIAADFTVILKKNNDPDSVRMNFTLFAPEPVLNWNSITVKNNDSAYQCIPIERVFQEKVKKNWQNRFQVMMPIRVFQQFLQDQSTGPEKKSVLIFNYDRQIINSQFKENERELLQEFYMQVLLDSKN
ncbi:MAG TPA: hypothetical protein PLD84_02065, partial [Chitinophagales bacterium]|nr:hypothetical protein [Chitinophagales bacterium]